MTITFSEVVGNNEVYLDCLNALCGNYTRKSFLDIGCNHAPFTPLLGFEERTYIDILDRELDHKREQQFFVKADALSFLLQDIGYSTIFSLDQIEHVTKKYGWEQIGLMMEKSIQSIFFTPLHEWMMTDDNDKNPESHRSLWTPDEFDEEDSIKLVFPKYHQQLGIGAWFLLKSEYGNLKMEFEMIKKELSTKSWFPEEQKEIGDKKLAGTLFVRNAIALDYCVEASVKSLQDCCDAVYIVDAGSTDNTLELLKGLLDDKTQIIECSKDSWDKIQGREKLSAFTNTAIEYAQKDGYEYQFNLQADEVLDPDSFKYIRQAIDLGEEGYFVSRHNLWGSADTMLNVRQLRKPCSTQICRLTKTTYHSVDDAESVNCPASLDFINKIQIWHCGFIRDKKKHIEKIREIQGNIFLMNVDHRVKDATEFDAWGMGFDKSDVIPIHKPLPIYLKDWVDKNKM